jgi:signal transduction histidine kinase
MIALESSKLFAGLAPEELHALKLITVTKAFDAGQPIFREGDPGDGLYVVGDGRVQISAVVGQDQQRTLSRPGPGEFFGEMALLDNGPRSASAVAEESSQLMFIPRDGLLELLERSPKLAFSMVREFSLRMREFNRQYVREVLQTERLALVGRFARSIVHDFKNPLAIIGLAAELGSAENASVEMRDLAKQRIRKQVDRLSNMINELLEFTRGARTNVVPALADYDLFMQQLLEDLEAEVAAKKVTLVCENPPPPVRLLLDPRRLAHVFQNLINNAVEAMPKGGKILLRFAVEEKQLVTEIEDTGPGFSPEILPRLFEPFATFGKAHGTGLGLSICQRIVEDHRGQIQARSEPSRGAIFVIRLPLPGQS